MVNGGDEVAVFDRHGQVDGVEVDFATEAARQVGAGIDHREELAAAGTEQTEPAVASLVRPLELRQEGGQSDFVADAVEQLAGEVFGHGSLLGRSRQLKLVHRLPEDGFVHSVRVRGHGLQQAGRGQIVDLPGHAATVIVDQLFDS